MAKPKPIPRNTKPWLRVTSLSGRACRDRGGLEKSVGQLTPGLDGLLDNLIVGLLLLVAVVDKEEDNQEGKQEGNGYAQHWDNRIENILGIGLCSIKCPVPFQLKLGHAQPVGFAPGHTIERIAIGHLGGSLFRCRGSIPGLCHYSCAVHNTSERSAVITNRFILLSVFNLCIIFLFISLSGNSTIDASHPPAGCRHPRFFSKKFLDRASAPRPRHNKFTP